MEYRILGPLEARKDGLAASPGGPKLRALLALLLVNANELVSHARLIDGLWGERPPESAAKALQVYVSQLRRELGRDVIRTRPGGYELVVDPDALDLLRFERLVAEARGGAPADAAAKLREALGALAGSGSCRRRRCGVRGGRDRAAGGASPCGDGGAHRRGARARPRRRARVGARAARRAEPRARAAAGPAHARALPLGPPGRCARVLPGRPHHARRRARDRARQPAARAAAGDSPPGSGARRPGR